MARWSAAIVRARTFVILAWVLVAIIGCFGAHDLQPRLTTSLNIPGSASAKADQVLQRAFHENNEGTFTVLYNFKSASESQIAQYESQITTAASRIPSAKVTQEKAVGGFIAASISTNYSLAKAATFTSVLRDELAREGLSGAFVTGPPAIFTDVTPTLSKDLIKGEIAAVVIAFLVLLLLFGFTLSVLIPFIFASIAISTSLGILDLLAHRFIIVLYIPNIVELIGLGLAIDYSLLILHRFHRENSLHREGAISRTMTTAGRTIAISGLTVAAGLATLLGVPVPFIRSLGMAGVLIPLISTFAALTLAPALLTFVKIPEGRAAHTGLFGANDSLARPFEKMARFIVKKPKRVIAGSLLLLSTVIPLIASLEVTPSSLTKIPSRLESGRALELATSKIGTGVITPYVLVIDLQKNAAADQPSVEEARKNLVTKLSKDSEVFLAASSRSKLFIDPTGRFLRIYIVGNHELGSPESNALIARERAMLPQYFGFPTGVRFYLGGAPAQGDDLMRALRSSLPWIVGIILLISYLLLARVFHSILLPFKAILLDLLSIAGAIGSLVLLFKYGVAHWLFGSYHLPRIESWVLLFLFAMLFGLSMDYEVFIVSRIRESWLSGKGVEESIIEGISQTGGVVTAAATIFLSALTGLIFGHFAGLQELGFGLAVGVLIDATIIRILLLPATMVLFGKWNWWLPKSKTPSPNNR